MWGGEERGEHIPFCFSEKKEGISSIIVSLEGCTVGQKQQHFCDNSSGIDSLACA